MMTAAATTSVLGLSAAAIWGASDFSGGMAARHLRVFWLLAISHSFSLICLLSIAGIGGLPVPTGPILLYGFLAGLAGGMALLAFYSALAMGEMGTTAALTGLLTATLPVVYTLLTLGAPSRRQVAGFVLAAAAIWLISVQPAEKKAVLEREHLRTGLAVLAGVGFGAFLIFLRLANGGGLVWPLAASRVGSLGLALGGALLFSRKQFRAEPATSLDGTRTLPRWKIGVTLAVLAGLCDTTGNFFFIAATRTGRLDIASVLASLYPASTIVLAAWLLRERTTRKQAIGMAAALAAVALIS